MSKAKIVINPADNNEAANAANFVNVLNIFFSLNNIIKTSFYLKII